MKVRVLLQYYFGHSASRPAAVFARSSLGKTLFQFGLERVLASFRPDQITAFVAESLADQGDLPQLLRSEGITWHPVKPGTISATIARVMDQSQEPFAARIIGNNPFIDASQVQACIKDMEKRGLDYLSFTDAPKGTTPSEIIRADALRKALHQEDFHAYLQESKDINIMSYFKRKPWVQKGVRDLKRPDVAHLDLSVSGESDFERLAPWFGKIPDFNIMAGQHVGKVVMAHIEPTNHCNLDCIMCARLTRRSFGTLRFDQFKTMVDKMPYLKRINFNGDGEPFLNKALPDMLAYAKERDIMTRTITNATIPVPDERLERILENLDFFNISIDGASAASFEAVRLKGDFALASNTVKHITATIRRKNLHFGEFWVNCVIQEANHTEIVAMVYLMAKLGVPALNFKLMNTNFDRGGSEFNDSNQLVKDRMETNKYYDQNWIFSQIEEARALGKKLGVEVYLERDIEPGFTYHSCGMSQRVFITYDGWVTPCCLRPEPSVFNFGNLIEQDYASIFGARKYLDFVQSLIRETPQEVCLRCPSIETLDHHREEIIVV